MNYSDQKIEQLLEQLIASTRSPRGRFSAEEGYKRLRHRLPISKRLLSAPKYHLLIPKHRSLPVRLMSMAAAIALLCILSWVAYYYATPPVMCTVSTLAERKSVLLPDGSTAVLNHFTTLTYPERFREKNRKVSLTGEACFEVSHDPQHPFIVQAEAIYVQVLGTHFNVEVYPDNPEIRTTLLQGAVAVSNSQGTERMILKPNESAIYNKEKGSFTLTAVPDPTSTIAWQQGNFIFQNESLQEIIRELSNSFGISIRIDDEALRNYRFTARFADGESLTYILDLLQQQAGCFSYMQENNQIIIQKVNP